MKTKFIFLGILFFIMNLNAQSDSLQVTSSKQYYDAIDRYFKKLSFDFGVGWFVPRGNLKNYFGHAPMFELNANFPLKKAKSLGAVLQFVIPNQQDDFVYLRTVDTVRAKSTLMFNALLRFKKRVCHSRASEVDLGLGIGLSVINTDARNPFYSGKDGENKYEIISTLLLQPGVAWSHKFFGDSEFSLGFYLQYAPYKIEGALREDIGSVALIPRISYKF